MMEYAMLKKKERKRNETTHRQEDVIVKTETNDGLDSSDKCAKNPRSCDSMHTNKKCRPETVCT